MLITTEQLAGHLEDPQWVVIDTRHDLMDPAKGRQAYDAGHIPGAYFVSVDDDLSGPKTGKTGRHPLPDLATFAARMNELGIGPQGLGGRSTSFAVHVEVAATHITQNPVAVNIQCHSARRARATITPGGISFSA